MERHVGERDDRDPHERSEDHTHSDSARLGLRFLSPDMRS